MSTLSHSIKTESFGSMLLRFREAAGFTQESLSRESGVSVNTISDLERGITSSPQRGTVQMLGKALGLQPGEAAAFISASRPDRIKPSSNLPVFRTSLIARERQSADIAELLLTDSIRLVTLTGTGGVGKTRLAVNVAADVQSHFSGGVCFVALSGIVDPDLVPGVIAAALGVRETPGRSVTDLITSHLKGRRTLIVLDNCEQVNIGPLVGFLLSACPALSILATSRASLHVTGEWEAPVQPLSLVDPDRLPSLSELALVASVELFISRAAIAKPGFLLTERNARTIAAICARLDGLPLAIELAAARMKVLSPGVLMGMLTERLRLLTDGPTDAPARQRSMRDAIACSENLLTDQERRAFRQFSVFAGGCSLEAATAVIGQGDPFMAMTGLTRLVDQSLLQRVEAQDDEPRFTMLETIREYSLEHLVRSGDEPDVRDRHADYFLTLAEQAEPELAGLDSLLWLGRLEMERDNLRSALHWLIVREKSEQSLRLAGALWRYWWLRGRLREGRDWIERALAAGRDATPVALSKALNILGNICSDLAEYSHARSAYEESLGLRRQVGDPERIAATLNNLGIVVGYLGDYQQAEALIREGIEIQGAAASEYDVALFNQIRGDLAFAKGDFELAVALARESLRVMRTHGSPQSIGYASFSLGRALRQLDPAEGVTLIENSRRIFDDTKDPLGLSLALHELGRVAYERGDLELAEKLFTESLLIANELGDTHRVLSCIEGLAEVACTRADWSRALSILCMVTKKRSELGRPLPKCEQIHLEETLRWVKGSLGNANWEEQCFRHKSLTIQEIVDQARSLA